MILESSVTHSGPKLLAVIKSSDCGAVGAQGAACTSLRNIPAPGAGLQKFHHSIEIMSSFQLGSGHPTFISNGVKFVPAMASLFNTAVT